MKNGMVVSCEAESAISEGVAGGGARLTDLGALETSVLSYEERKESDSCAHSGGALRTLYLGSSPVVKSIGQLKLQGSQRKTARNSRSVDGGELRGNVQASARSAIGTSDSPDQVSPPCRRGHPKPTPCRWSQRRPRPEQEHGRNG